MGTVRTHMLYSSYDRCANATDMDPLRFGNILTRQIGTATMLPGALLIVLAIRVSTTRTVSKHMEWVPLGTHLHASAASD